jgi:hypothetical protein
MSGFRPSSPTRLAFAAAAGLLLLSSSASYANDFEQLFPGGVHEAPAQPRAHYRSGGNGFYSTYPGQVPNDFSSSHVCIDGYRWITRELEWFESPAENAIPVRC